MTRRSDERVTILLPTYNVGRFLQERMESILAQSFSHWRLVIYDSFSTDETMTILAPFLKDPRITFLQGPREGIYRAWNVLRQHVRGEYCYIATGDDTMSPEFLAVSVAILDRHAEAAAFACPVTFIDEHSMPRRFQMSQHPAGAFLPLAEDKVSLRDGADDALLHLAVDMVYISMTGLLFRSTDFLKEGDFRVDLGSSADREWLLRFLPGRKLAYWGKPLATWRVHNRQATASLRAAGEMRKREAYEDECIVRGIDAGYWPASMRQAWNRTTRTRQFLLRAEYRSKRGMISTAKDLLEVAGRHPIHTGRWLVWRVLGVNWCQQLRVDLGRTLLAQRAGRAVASRT